MINSLSIATDGYLGGDKRTLAISVSGYLFDLKEAEEVIKEFEIKGGMVSGGGGYGAKKLEVPKKTTEDIQKLKQLIREDEELLLVIQAFVLANK